MTDPQDVISALTEEGDELDQMVAGLEPRQWALPTPAPGWTIAHQIAHLTATFAMATLAASDPMAFKKMTERLSDDFDANVKTALAPYLAQAPEELLVTWRAGRAAAAGALGSVPPGRLVPWLVRSIPAPVLGCAGFMELFAHGQDIADALGATRERGDRIRHLIDFAVLTWDFGYQARDLTPPDQRFRFELTAPSGALWTYGPEDAEQRITGSAADFCLLVTRRRHRDDLTLSGSGAEADRWLTIAQAYRGPAGPGRSPGQFARSRFAAGR